MPIDFPNNPTSGYIYTYGSRSWQWDGTAWNIYSSGSGISGPYVSTFNGLTGGVTLAAGTNITLIPLGNVITIDASGGAGGITQYVSSIRGLTGAVGITNGSGMGLSVSGQTMTFSNTGVLSVDGVTGAVNLKPFIIAMAVAL